MHADQKPCWIDCTDDCLECGDVKAERLDIESTAARRTVAVLVLLTVGAFHTVWSVVKAPFVALSDSIDYMEDFLEVNW